MTKLSKRKTDFRFRITTPIGDRTYLFRTGNKVHYRSGAENPLTLSSLFGANATEVRFSLEDALQASDALRIVRAALGDNIKVEVI